MQEGRRRKDEVLIMAEEALRMSHIVKIYPNGVMANKDVTLSVNLGEMHAYPVRTVRASLP